MLVHFKKLVFAMILIAPSAALSQDQAEANENAASDLAQGQPVQPEIVTETFGDWTVNCQSVSEAERCEMSQLLLNQDNTPAVEVSLFRIQQEGQVFAGGTVVAPLGTLLTSSLTIAVDDALGKTYPFSYCLPDGCVSRIGLSVEDIEDYKKGSVATFTLRHVQNPNLPIDLTMSLAGFTKAFDRLPQ